MNGPVCEVIGCARPASWVVQGAAELERELYLCERCRLELAQQRPAAADLYIRIELREEKKDDRAVN
ncbi:MAG TPA: hypothetical protein VGS41_15705 [Chthonomonadales bacterium]|nr:hypothetical protein [Chthonomonadales bacterium]